MERVLIRAPIIFKNFSSSSLLKVELGYDTVYFDPKGSVEISDKFATYFVMCNFKGCKKIYSNKNRGGGHLSYSAKIIKQNLSNFQKT